MKRILIFFALLSCYSFAYAQEELVEYFPAGRADTEIYSRGYITPLADAAMVAIHAGWYSNGAPHSKWGIEFNVTANTRFVPSDQELFSVTGLTNSAISSSNPFGNELPAVYGPEGNDPLLVFQDGSADDGQIFEAPDGNDLSEDFLINAVIVPTFQLGIGLIKDTDLKIRYTPDLGIDSDVEFSTFGVGLMHSIKQHIPGIKLAPFGLSLLAAYSRMDGEIDLSGEFTGTNQVAEFNVSGLTVQVVGSKKFSVLTGYAGLGFYTSNADFDILGNYQIPAGTFIGNGNNTVYQLQADHSLDLNNNPINLPFDKSGVRATIGLRVKLGVLTIHSDYTLQENSMLVVGLGFSVKE